MHHCDMILSHLYIYKAYYIQMTVEYILMKCTVLIGT
jgi:hypothetical protein